jgi:hypothetical protein
MANNHSTSDTSDISGNKLIEFYKEICTNIRASDDISFKILQATPIISALGSGTLTYLQGPSQLNGRLAVAVIVFSVFGALITFGLFKFELRNIRKCKWLIACAVRLEAQLLPVRQLTNEDLPFRGIASQADLGAQRMEQIDISSRGEKRRYWGKTEAEKFIYVTAIIAWLIPAAVAIHALSAGK